MVEKSKRLAPKSETLRELFLKSGNLCAFPGCGSVMMNPEGLFVGQVCHIEAAEEGGERFNISMTNEERRSASNLMLMCYPHHQQTNDIATYPVDRLQQFKVDHERRFSRPDRAILERLTDWTTVDQPAEVRNLWRMNSVLCWNLNAQELQECVDELNAHITLLRRVPIDVRRFLGAVTTRIVHMMGTNATRTGMFGSKILARDLEMAFRLSDRAIAERVNQLSAYSLGCIDEMDTDLGVQYAVRIYDFGSGWPFWIDLAKFCLSAPELISVFTDDLEFTRLDGIQIF